MDELIARMKTRATLVADLNKNYTFKETIVADDFDSHGNKKGTHTDEYQVWYVKNVEVQQHLSHDGKPLKEDDERKEQERVNKKVASIKDGSYKPPKGNVGISVAGLMKVVTFTNERRTEINGRPTIMFDYTGDPHAKTAVLTDEIMKRLKGQVWLDEQDAALVRLQGTLAENFHVAGGLLVNVKAGSWFDYYTLRINDEVWFPKTFDAHVDGRILLLKGFDGDAHMTFSEYRKMKTTVTLLPGSQVIDETGKPIPGLTVEPETPARDKNPDSTRTVPEAPQ